MTALTAATRNNDIEVVKALLEAGANVNYQNCYGETALHIASEWGFKDIITLLLQSGADPSIKSKFKETFLDNARDDSYAHVEEWVREQYPEVVKYITKKRKRRKVTR